MSQRISWEALDEHFVRIKRIAEGVTENAGAAKQGRDPLQFRRLGPQCLHVRYFRHQCRPSFVVFYMTDDGTGFKATADGSATNQSWGTTARRRRSRNLFVPAVRGPGPCPCPGLRTGECHSTSFSSSISGSSQSSRSLTPESSASTNRETGGADTISPRASASSVRRVSRMTRSAFAIQYSSSL